MAQIISPFIKYCSTIGVVPSTYEENLTYIECLNFMIKFLNDVVIPAFNENDAAFAALQVDYTQFKEDILDAFNTLQNYVDTYFENLDIQEEINNKLDDMVEDGTIEAIITAYLQISGVLSYDTVANMASSSNIINGSICKTCGRNSYDDGEGAYYRVRTVTNTDVVDGINIVALSVSNTLIAELVPEPKKNHIYLGSFFKSGDKLALCVSDDGFNFSDILGDLDLTARDPSIMYDAETELFYIACTSNYNGRDCVVWTSPDLKTWTDHSISLGVNTGFRWAPEWFKDDNGKIYLFISGGTLEDTTVTDADIYYAECTDLSTLTFGEATEIDLGIKAIDPSVIKDGNKYYLLVKDEDTSVEKIYQSTDLSTWSAVNTNVLKSAEPCEGGMIVKCGDKINFYGDTWQSHGHYVTGQTSDITSFNITHNNTLIGKRHGSVAYIDDGRAIDIIGKLASDSGAVNIVDEITRSFDLSGTYDKLIVLPKCTYRITGNTTITNLCNPYHLASFNFAFAADQNARLEVTNVVNSENQTISANLNVKNSIFNNRKYNSIPLIGSINNPIYNNRPIDLDKTSIVAASGWTISVSELCVFENFIHITMTATKTDAGAGAVIATIPAAWQPRFSKIMANDKLLYVLIRETNILCGTATVNQAITINDEYMCY